MTTIKPTMNLMALLKAGATIEADKTRLRYNRGMITVYLFHDDGNWRICQNFQGNKEGLEQAVEYINLPI